MSNLDYLIEKEQFLGVSKAILGIFYYSVMMYVFKQDFWVRRDVILL